MDKKEISTLELPKRKTIKIKRRHLEKLISEQERRGYRMVGLCGRPGDYLVCTFTR